MECKSSKLDCSREKLEAHLQQPYSDPQRNKDLPLKKGLPKSTAPGVNFDLGDLKMSEVGNFIKKTRSKSAPGQDGVPYKVYKQCPRHRHKLFSILNQAWREKVVADKWCTAEGVHLPKEKDSSNPSQF